GTGSTSNTTSLAGILSGAVQVVPGQTSGTNLLIIAVTRANVIGTSINDFGMRLGIKAYDEGASNWLPAATRLDSQFSSSTNGASIDSTVVQTLVSTARLTDAERRTNGNWTPRVYGNAVYAGSTVTHEATTFICIEYE